MPHQRFARAQDSNNEPTDPSETGQSLKQMLRIARYPVITVILIFSLTVDFTSVKKLGKQTEASPLRRIDASIIKKAIEAGNETSSLVKNEVAVVEAKTSISTEVPKDLVSSNNQQATLQTQPNAQVPSDIHSPHLEILELLDWEIESLKGIQNISVRNWTNEEKFFNVKAVSATCNPPEGVNKKCCLGSFSTGGGVDSTIRYHCEAPMEGLSEVEQATRNFFRNNPLPNAESMKCDVCKILELARRDNLVIGWLGDSMQNQVFDGFTCEMERRGYYTSIEVIRHEVPTAGAYQYKHGYTNVAQVRSPLWGAEESVKVLYHQMYMVPFLPGAGDIMKMAAEIDVMILGLGLHWWKGEVRPGVEPDKFEAGYIKSMAALLRNVTENGHVKLLVHRETSAQHFDADGGEYYRWSYKQNHAMACVPFSLDDETVYWREKAILKAAQQAGLSLVPAWAGMLPSSNQTSSKLAEVISLPYYYFTAQFPNMHPMRLNLESHTIDCTHYCGSPSMYYPLWRSLRLAMDRRFAST